ncbi:MAG: hypothetical protein NUV46_03030 [Nanoarchaeota archaeon]|nr:hypothetical protein [Nanoarchaeota archaeon]
MKRFSVVFALGVILLLGTGVLAESFSISDNTEKFVKKIASNRGVAEESITSITQVDLNDLPEEVNIQNIDDTAIAMYQIEVEGEKPVYVITASEMEIKKQVENLLGKMLLNFGTPGEVSESTFLSSSAGVKGSENKGYAMIRSGSITGISTNLEVLNSGIGEAEVIIFKNGEVVGFRNTFDLSENGIKSDYDTVGENIVNFNKGDIISVKVVLPSGVFIKDVNTLLEITAKE